MVTIRKDLIWANVSPCARTALFDNDAYVKKTATINFYSVLATF